MPHSARRWTTRTFVRASTSLFRHSISCDKSRAEYSYCTWPEGVAAWLPRAECIAFTGKRADKRWYLIVPWDAAVAICGNLLTLLPNTAPARFQTTGWPDIEQLRYLAEVAIVRSP